MPQIREWISESGKRIVRLHQREDHLFWFEEIYENVDDYAGVYWAPGYQSGVFESAELAVAEIQAITPWLKPLANDS